MLFIFKEKSIVSECRNKIFVEWIPTILLHVLYKDVLLPSDESINQIKSPPYSYQHFEVKKQTYLVDHQRDF